ncbi:hypothetical protein NFI96_034626 [Prochilodus magdalenae]|nr:hypothetical protein NFI96_034626 [Prochilodus magdalenae]
MFAFWLMLFVLLLPAGFLKPQCSLAPPPQRGRAGEACSCFSGMCPLHQRRLSTEQAIGPGAASPARSKAAAAALAQRLGPWPAGLTHLLLQLARRRREGADRQAEGAFDPNVTGADLMKWKGHSCQKRRPQQLPVTQDDMTPPGSYHHHCKELRVDSSGHMTSSPLSSPTSHRGMHPPLLSPTSIGASGSLHSPISSLSSPMNGLGSPFSVISSPMGPHSMASPGMGYGPSVSPQNSRNAFGKAAAGSELKEEAPGRDHLAVAKAPIISLTLSVTAALMGSFSGDQFVVCLGSEAEASRLQWRMMCVSVLWPSDSVQRAQCASLQHSCQHLNSPMNSVSSSEDIKPPLGLNGVMKVPAQPSGTPISLTKHICAICGDRSSGKHYGVYSCEGCKGFFKRTVRKDLTYTCRDNKDCMIDKRQRNRCQYCRYQKCLAMGMKREAVQEERQRAKDRNENEVESTSSANEDMPVEKILEAELAVEPKTETYIETNLGMPSNSPNDPVTNICQAADKQLFTLVEWAKRIPHFSELPLDDQVILLRAGWNELLIASFSHRSIAVKDGILLATGLHVHRNSAHSAGVGAIFDRVLTELVSKMRDMQMDKTELGCLRAIVLFNPDSKGLSNPGEVEALREKVYASLEAYCKQKYPEQPGRFAKLLLRLPALRSIGLKCLEHLFFFKLIGDTPIDTFLMEMLEAPHQMT